MDRMFGTCGKSESCHSSRAVSRESGIAFITFRICSRRNICYFSRGKNILPEVASHCKLTKTFLSDSASLEDFFIVWVMAAISDCPGDFFFALLPPVSEQNVSMSKFWWVTLIALLFSSRWVALEAYAVMRQWAMKRHSVNCFIVKWSSDEERKETMCTGRWRELKCSHFDT